MYVCPQNILHDLEGKASADFDKI